MCRVSTEPENINYSINTMCGLWWVLTVENSYRNITGTPVSAGGTNVLLYKSTPGNKAAERTLQMCKTASSVPPEHPAGLSTIHLCDVLITLTLRVSHPAGGQCPVCHCAQGQWCSLYSPAHSARGPSYHPAVPEPLGSNAEQCVLGVPPAGIPD